MSHEDQENYDDYNGDQDNKYDQPYDEPNRGDDYGLVFQLTSVS